MDPQKAAQKLVEGASHGQVHGSAHGHVSYVESWLETQVPAAVSSMPSVEVPGHSKDRKKTHQPQRRLSQDSSIIASAAPRHRRSGDRHQVYNHQMPGELRDAHKPLRSKRARPNSNIDSDRDGVIEAERRRYEKRARHKTREDKYEQNRGGAARRKLAEGEPKGKGTKRHDKRTKKKPALATARELMDKFSSNAIHNDRLTVSPPSLLCELF